MMDTTETPVPGYEAQIEQLNSLGWSTRQIAEAVHVSQSTVVRKLNKTSGPQPVLHEKQREAVIRQRVMLILFAVLVLVLAVLAAAVATLAWG